MKSVGHDQDNVLCFKYEPQFNLVKEVGSCYVSTISPYQPGACKAPSRPGEANWSPLTRSTVDSFPALHPFIFKLTTKAVHAGNPACTAPVQFSGQKVGKLIRKAKGNGHAPVCTHRGSIWGWQHRGMLPQASGDHGPNLAKMSASDSVSHPLSFRITSLGRFFLKKKSILHFYKITLENKVIKYV